MGGVLELSSLSRCGNDTGASTTLLGDDGVSSTSGRLPSAPTLLLILANLRVDCSGVAPPASSACAVLLSADSAGHGTGPATVIFTVDFEDPLSTGVNPRSCKSSEEASGSRSIVTIAGGVSPDDTVRNLDPTRHVLVVRRLEHIICTSCPTYSLSALALLRSRLTCSNVSRADSNLAVQCSRTCEARSRENKSVSANAGRSGNAFVSTTPCPV